MSILIIGAWCMGIIVLIHMAVLRSKGLKKKSSIEAKRLRDAEINKHFELEASDMEAPVPPVPPDISEPVISFVKVLESNPERFKTCAKNVSKYDLHSRHKTCSIKDLETGEVFSGRYYLPRPGRCKEYAACDSHPWVTKDEAMLVYLAIHKIRVQRWARVMGYKARKKCESDFKERSRLEAIYKE